MRDHLPDHLFGKFSYATKQYYLLRFKLLEEINVDDSQYFREDISRIVKIKGAYQN